jgi:AbrB family looped-hinge helix DNA binding protein
MKELLASVTTKGQVTIPVEVRRLLGIAPHDKVAFVVDGAAVHLARKGSVVAQTAGALKSQASPMTAEQLREAAEEAIAEEAVKRASG